MIHFNSKKNFVLLISIFLINKIVFTIESDQVATATNLISTKFAIKPKVKEVSPFTTNYEHIESLVNKYNIDVTILEVANSEDELYSFNLAKKANCVCIILLMNYGAESVIQRIKKDDLKNIIVLEPRDLDIHMVNALSRCEHIDVAIVHDHFNYFQNQWKSTADLFLNLGNHIFFEIDYDNAVSIINYKYPNFKMIENRFKNLLFYYQTEKKFLEIARFTQFTKPKGNGNNYEIKSDFNEKLLLKKDPETTSKWVAGINLMTYVMLRGVYPTDDIIRNEIQNIEKAYPYHNDLIIGNMVIQGHKIVPIDFNDKRRSANMEKMLTRATSFFNGSNDRLKNPTDTVNRYYKKHHQENKKK